MNTIKFGTDGWRAIIAKDFTTDNLIRVSEGVARWLIAQDREMPKSAVIGYDCRFGGEMFAETVAKVLAFKGIKTYLSKNFASTPMVSLGTMKYKAGLGIVITASHNPPSYNGFKLKGPYGGPILPATVQEIENLIPGVPTINVDKIPLKGFFQNRRIELIDLETLYCDHLEENFDLDAIRNSRLQFAYDAMYGAGQNVISRVLPDTSLIHCEYNPSFMGKAPEPVLKNLEEFSSMIKTSGNFDAGFATDGDADRIGLLDDKGNFIDSHHLILLLIKYLFEIKKMRGKVVTSLSVSSKIPKMCRMLGLEHEETKIGFKHIAGKMVDEDVLLGGEESGGIAIKGHIPERDGIWIGLTIWEYMAKSGKSLHELIQEVYSMVGRFSFERLDLHLQDETKDRIVENCKKDLYKSFGDFKIQRRETVDGYKYFFNDFEWLMIRASGTEPVLRSYAESDTPEKTISILKAAEQTLLRDHLP